MKKVVMIGLIITIPILILAVLHFHATAMPSDYEEGDYDDAGFGSESEHPTPSAETDCKPGFSCLGNYWP